MNVCESQRSGLRNFGGRTLFAVQIVGKSMRTLLRCRKALWLIVGRRIANRIVRIIGGRHLKVQLLETVLAIQIAGHANHAGIFVDDEVLVNVLGRCTGFLGVLV